MFGYVMANSQELRPEQRERYLGCYCGICRAIGARASLASRVALNYDMVFLALLLSSLYEPAEEQGSGRCLVHPWPCGGCFGPITRPFRAGFPGSAGP